LPGSERSRNDLKGGSAKRVLTGGDLTAKVTYSTQISRWTATAAKPFNVEVTASVKGRNQKLYLSALTVYVTPWNDSVALDPPEPLEDVAPISPGYLITAPDTYTQSFALPPVDPQATVLTVQMRFEILQLRGKARPADYSKRTVTNSLTIPLTSGG
jgi:hypothetical protein